MKWLFLPAFVLTLIAQPAMAASEVVATIKPLHSLVAGVMGETGSPELLVDGAQSIHGFSLKPSQAQALHEAKVIFYIDPKLETFVSDMDDNKQAAVAMSQAPGVTLLTARNSNGDKAPNMPNDLHIWLSVDNAKAMVTAIEKALSKTFPKHKAAYEANAKKLAQDLDKLDKQLTKQLAPVKKTPYITFHDAFQYFAKAYGLNGQGALINSPEMPASLRRVGMVRKTLREKSIACIFSEPQFDSRLVNTAVEGTKVRRATLDEVGLDIEPGRQLYFTLMYRLAESFSRCLKV